MQTIIIIKQFKSADVSPLKSWEGIRQTNDCISIDLTLREATL